MLKTITCICIFFLSTVANTAPGSFSKAKRIAKTLFNDVPVTLYCGCSYDSKNRVNLASCNMQSASAIKRANRIEWEHMMPAENFGRHFQCWREKICTDKNGKTFKGRKCCQKIDSAYREVESELYNLWPAVGLVNGARSNYRFSPLPQKSGFYGCEIEIDSKLRKVDPPLRAKGTVARANLFMAHRYKINLSASQRKLFEAWNKKFPADAREKRWAQAVSNIEGYQNPYYYTAN